MDDQYDNIYTISITIFNPHPLYLPELIETALT